MCVLDVPSDAVETVFRHFRGEIVWFSRFLAACWDLDLFTYGYVLCKKAKSL